MPETLLTIWAWAIAGLWTLALWWTHRCFRGQKSLSSADESKLENQPLVSVIVPARNEAQRVLEKSVGSMLAQDYANFELIVVDDRSTDATREILEKLLLNKSEIRNPKSQIINGVELPAGWLGKPHALRQAFEKSAGEWILTTDADIIFAPEAVSIAVSYAEKNNFDSLTLIPRQLFGSFWERLFMPVFGWFCLIGMPPHRVNDPNRPETLGVGNFFLFRRSCLKSIGGFEAVKSDVAEDLKLAELVKSNEFRLRLDYAPRLIETRMYSGLGEIWQGFSKNLFSGLKFSVPKTVFSLISILLFGVLPVFLAVGAAVTGNFRLALPLFLVYILQSAVFVLTHRKWQGSLKYSLLAPLGFALFFAILFNSAFRVLSGAGVSWKGREIYGAGGIHPPKN